MNPQPTPSPEKTPEPSPAEQNEQMAKEIAVYTVDGDEEADEER